VLPPSQPARERGSRVICSPRSQSLARLALTRVPLVATLGIELGILGEKPQALEWMGPGRFECPWRSAIRCAHCNPNAWTISVVERHRSSPGICGVDGAEHGGSRQDFGDYSAMTAHWIAESRFLPICEFCFTGIESLLPPLREMSVNDEVGENRAGRASGKVRACRWLFSER
jgi:hypothetical protein